ncbi:MAG TPA: hypothetical protein VFV58_21735 [Blastocatellia bacterium]|jgi:hypothetical protein|nr:hypothetical protein [Blastocatellia bacterium]
MKKTLIRLLIMTCLLAVGSLNSVAQEKKPRPEVTYDLTVPVDGAFKVLGRKFANGRVVKGAPYSATATTESIQTLSDGNQIIRKNQSKLYRDSEGRTRTEQTLETIGKWTSGGEAQQGIFINDPVAGHSYSLDPRTRTAYKNLIPIKRLAAGAQSETLMINGRKVTTYTINGKTATQAEFEAFAAAKKKREAQEELPVKPRREAPDDSESKKKIETLKPGQQVIKHLIDVEKKTDSLGTQTIEGVTAEGRRETLTIPAGDIGNTLPIEVVDETWYSPELQITVMTRHRDPRSGETTYRLTNISRSEPDRSLFEVPADYTVAEGKMPPNQPIKRRPAKEE